MESNIIGMGKLFFLGTCCWVRVVGSMFRSANQIEIEIFNCLHGWCFLLLWNVFSSRSLTNTFEWENESEKEDPFFLQLPNGFTWLVELFWPRFLQPILVVFFVSKFVMLELYQAKNLEPLRQTHFAVGPFVFYRFSQSNVFDRQHWKCLQFNLALAKTTTTTTPAWFVWPFCWFGLTFANFIGKKTIISLIVN